MVLHTRNFFFAFILTIFVSVLIFFATGQYGKNASFLVLNHDLGKAADRFFLVISWLGEGWLWLPVAAWLAWKKKKKLFLFAVVSFLVSTLFIQAGKRFVFPGEKRPYSAIENKAMIHIVPQEKPHQLNSFPSGHTATAFTFYLFFSLVLGNWWVITGMVLALGVGYARVYLAQHFPFDVAGGMLCAAMAAGISYLVTRKYLTKPE